MRMYTLGQTFALQKLGVFLGKPDRVEEPYPRPIDKNTWMLAAGPALNNDDRPTKIDNAFRSHDACEFTSPHSTTIDPT